MSVERVVQKALEELSLVLAATTDPKEIEDFFYSILTPTEVGDIGTRWALVREIDRGTTQREIARKYSLSLCKITRGSRELKRPNSPFKRMLEKFEEIS